MSAKCFVYFLREVGQSHWLWHFMGQVLLFPHTLWHTLGSPCCEPQTNQEGPGWPQNQGACQAVWIEHIFRNGQNVLLKQAREETSANERQAGGGGEEEEENSLHICYCNRQGCLLQKVGAEERMTRRVFQDQFAILTNAENFLLQ